jgi:hypothetical protein
VVAVLLLYISTIGLLVPPRMTTMAPLIIYLHQSIGVGVGNLAVKVLLFKTNNQDARMSNLDNVMATTFWGLSFIINFSCTGKRRFYFS